METKEQWSFFDALVECLDDAEQQDVPYTEQLRLLNEAIEMVKERMQERTNKDER